MLMWTIDVALSASLIDRGGKGYESGIKTFIETELM